MKIKLFLLSFMLWNASPIQADSYPFVGEVMYVAFNFCPTGWAPAEGQLLPLSQNTALFSLLGTQFGGNGKSNFALPDLQARFMQGKGQGPGLSNVEIGETTGSNTITLTQNQIPMHSHFIDVPSPKQGVVETLTVKSKIDLAVANVNAEERLPMQNRLAKTAQNRFATQDTVLADSLRNVTATPASSVITTSSVGGGQPLTKMPPYLTLKACIALQGIFPQRP